MREIDVPMPKLSMTMEEGELIAWRKQEGDQVRAGEVICEVNSDKVEMEVESPADGTLVRHTAAEGEIVPVGAPIATLATEAEDLLGGVLGPEPPPATPEPPGPKPVVPAARRRAAELGVDLAAVTGTGRDGLVRVDDVEAAAGDSPRAAPVPAPVAPAGEAEQVPVSAMRRVIARRLTESMQTAPHVYLTSKVDATRMLSFRAELNHQLQHKISLNDLIVKACAGLLAANRELNVSWAGDNLLVHQRVHVGIAVALETGLLVPVVHDADHKSLSQIARDSRALIDQARAGTLSADQTSGGTFTISNLGMYGIEQFTAVINPPQAAILAVGAALPEPLPHPDGTGVQVHQMLRLTLSIDHRALDGATGARFLQQLKAVLEHPLQIVA